MATTAAGSSSRVKARVAGAGALLAATLAVLVPPTADAGAVGAAWGPTGSLAAGRERATATLLADGTVLVAGGAGRDADNVYRTRSSAEIYDPASKTWSATTGSMVSARRGHTATLLPNGAVVMVGGANDDPGGATLASAEIYDPVARTFAVTGSMAMGRQGHTATLLDSGEILVVGGSSDAAGSAPLGTAEVYNRGLGTWRPTGTRSLWPPITRVDNRANLLTTGHVLLTGDQPVQRPAAELYHPHDEVFSFTGAMSRERRNHTATRLFDGRVLIQGGVGADADGEPDGSAEVFHPDVFDPDVGALGDFIDTASLAHGSRRSATATLLPDGTVLVAGGTGITEASASPVAEVYHPSAGTWSEAGAMAGARFNHTATLLTTGKVLVVGGSRGSGGSTLASAELYDPGPQPQRTVSLALKKHVVAFGVVAGPQPCIGSLEVVLRLNGVRVASTTSAPDGSYTVKLPDRQGQYQAVVKPPTVVDDIPCNKAASPFVAHLH